MGSGATKQKKDVSTPTKGNSTVDAVASQVVTTPVPEAAGESDKPQAQTGSTEEPEMTEAEIGIKNIIDKIWSDYDSDKNGHLDRQEVFQFLQTWLGSNDSTITEEAVRHVFEEFDVDGSDTVDKEEMLAFLQRVYKSGS